MKILIVRPFPNILDPNQYNMQELGLAKALTKRGHTCGIVLYYGKNKDKVDTISVECEEGAKNITIYRLHGYNFLKNGMFPSLKRISKQYDVIQVHEYDQITSWLYYAWSKQKVVIYHGPYYHTFNKRYNLKCKLFDYTFLKIHNNPNVECMTKSNAAADFLRMKGFRNVTPVGVGLDTEVFKNVVKEDETNHVSTISVSNDKFTWIYVGKMEERRNTLFLMDIINELFKKYKNMEFILVGNGETRYKQECLDKVQKLIDRGSVSYYSSASQKELANLYREADGMLFPSNYDIFGMVLLEAMYFKLPVISSSNGGADMLIKNGVNGIIVNEFKINTWVNNAEKLACDREFYNKICFGIQKDETQMLDWDYIAIKMEKSYQV